MTSSSGFRVPDFSNVQAAADDLRGQAVETPLLESPLVNARLGGRLLVKAEVLQRTGSFKFRGAFNRLSWLTDDERAAGVVAFSSGNHAQGVAHAAALLGVPATIVMPRDAPPLKIENTRAYGAEVVLYDRKTENREAIGEALAAERGLTLVRPYDDPDVIAGQGTVALEVVEQARLKDLHLDAFLVPCGGGGLTAGCALALAEESPDTALFTVEPEGYDDTARSLAGGQRVENDMSVDSVCDALLAPTPGELTFGINTCLVSGGLAVDEAAVFRAMATAFKDYKIVVEPGGAVALAAVLSGAFDVRDKTVAVVCSGGNVAPDLFARALAAAGEG
ncbi:MAG: threonine/serine dehydratase [Rhodobacterales bacterium]|nr:threonine/serine dehydratase [Rhodobacterales bacterium]